MGRAWQAQEGEGLHQHWGTVTQLHCTQLHEGVLRLAAGAGWDAGSPVSQHRSKH